MGEMMVVDENVIAQRQAEARQAAYAEHQRLVAATNALNTAGMTIEQMRAAIAQADDMKAAADAYSAEQARIRKAQEREAAEKKAEQDAAEVEARAAQFKARQLANWIAGGLGTEREFERQWDSIRLSLFAQQQQSGDDDRVRDEVRARTLADWSKP